MPLLVRGRRKSFLTKGIQNKGEYVALRGHTPVAVKKVKIIKHFRAGKKYRKTNQAV